MASPAEAVQEVVGQAARTSVGRSMSVDGAWAAPRSAVPARIALVASDVLAFAAAVTLARMLHARLLGATAFGWGTIGAGCAWLVLRSYARLYAPEGMASPEEFRRDVTATSAIAGTYLLIAFAQHLAQPTRPVFLGVWLFLLPISVLFRGGVKRALARSGLWGRPVVVLGAGRMGRLVIHELLANPLVGLRPVAVFDDDPRLQGASVHGVPVVGKLAEAATWPFDPPVADAIVALPHMPRDQFSDLTRSLAGWFRSLRVVPDLFGMVNLWVQPGALGSCLALELRHERFDRGRQRVKRAFDLIVGIPAFVAALPIIALAALAVKLVSPGPAFFAQPREGVAGRRVRVWKIRSMVPNAAEVLEERLDGDVVLRAEWEKKMKLRDDPRILPYVGRFLRRSSIDELPQIWNVIRGDLSLVGPRPFPDYHLCKYDAAFRALRREVAPGITGYWQVTARSDSNTETQAAADSYYIHNWSLWLDVWILMRTVAVVLTGRGAY